MSSNNLFVLQDSSSGTAVTLKVDPNGYILYWTDQHKVGDIVIEPDQVLYKT